MSQRPSGYERKADDAYETPAWVTRALLPHLPPCKVIFEPAAGSGAIAYELQASKNWHVIHSDIRNGHNFLDCKSAGSVDCILTNPPFTLARQFIEHSLDLMMPKGGTVAMLLRTDYDHAKTRRHLFGDCKAFHKKLVLTKRIVWFERSGAAPSFNHAWFIWDWKHSGPPVLAYGPHVC